MPRPAPPACTLRAAVLEANALVAAGSAVANVINLPGGTYTLTVAGKGENGAATGDLDLNGGALEVKGAGSGTTIIDGNQLDRLFHLGPVTPAQFSLAGVTIRNGNAVSIPPDLSNSGTDAGGGIRIEKNSGLAVRKVTLRSNRAGQRGGAIAMPPSAGTVVGADPAIITDLTDVTMENNSAGVEGGATFNNRIAFFTRVIVKDNTVTGTVGNERGAGIAQSGDLTLTDVIVSGNSMARGSGGGIANRGDPVARIFGTIRLNRVTVSDNSAEQGGGVATGNGANAFLTNTTISDNTATSNGGGFINLGTATLTNVTLSGNSAPAGGGGVVTFGPMPGAMSASTTLRNTIVADSAGGNCLLPPPPFARPPASGGDNISSDTSCNLTGPGDSNGTDPRLGPPAGNGGFTPTHALLAGSPAIDGVNNNTCPPPATDQRGVRRPQGARCDIGVYERGVAPTVPPVYPYPRPLVPFAGCPSLTTNVIRGTSAANTIVGTVRGDRIFAGAGADVVLGLAGDDCLDLGSGADRGDGGLGDDLILGGLGNDRLSGGASGNDRLHGLSGNDRISGEGGRDTVRGGAGGDRISGGSSGDRIAGGAGNDRISGGSGNDRIEGNSGKDRLEGGSGRDSLSGGSGNDRIDARDGRRDRISCGTGRDTVLADRIDRVSRSCERVRRVRSRRTRSAWS